jgi:hypothetical protein
LYRDLDYKIDRMTRDLVALKQISPTSQLVEEKNVSLLTPGIYLLPSCVRGFLLLLFCFLQYWAKNY